MKKIFVEPSIIISEFEENAITMSGGTGNYPGYQRVIDSLKTQSLNADAEIVDWYAE